MKMNEAVKTKWIEALLSEEYLQGKGCLKRGEEYCCLGVLTELYIQEHGGEPVPHERRVVSDDNCLVGGHDRHSSHVS